MHLLRFRRYLEDLDRLYDALDLDPTRTVQQGYSLGGLVTARFAQCYPKRLRAISLTCPLLGLSVKIPRLLYATGRVLSVTYPWKRFRSDSDASDVTHCPMSLAERQSDGLYRQDLTAGWFFAVRRAINNAWRTAATLTTPTLLVQSEEDHVVDALASRNWIEQIGSPQTRYLSLPGHFHEWHYEQNWARTTDEIERWLATRLDDSGLLLPTAFRRAA